MRRDLKMKGIGCICLPCRTEVQWIIKSILFNLACFIVVGWELNGDGEGRCRHLQFGCGIFLGVSKNEFTVHVFPIRVRGCSQGMNGFVVIAHRLSKDCLAIVPKRHDAVYGACFHAQSCLTQSSS
jgi:hypothetical protein